MLVLTEILIETCQKCLTHTKNWPDYAKKYWNAQMYHMHLTVLNFIEKRTEYAEIKEIIWNEQNATKHTGVPKLC